MSIVSDLLNIYLPAKRKTTPSGWTSFNAPCCVHNNENADTRGRGGVIYEGAGFKPTDLGYKKVSDDLNIHLGTRHNLLNQQTQLSFLVGSQIPQLYFGKDSAIFIGKDVNAYNPLALRTNIELVTKDGEPVKKHEDAIIIRSGSPDTLSGIFFEEKLKNKDIKLYVSTDDGSQGYNGFASDLADDLLKKQEFASVITCGPEIMMKKLLDNCKNIPFQASLERFMKCAVGLCGQCCIGEGIRVCKEGPVLDGAILKNIKEFGAYKRDAAGRKVKF